jgi:ATP-dependent DNA ligase
MAFQRKKPAAIGVKAPYPGFIEPALATSIDKVPNGERWIHEIKFDGYRVQVHLVNEAVKVFTRRGNDWTKARSTPRPLGLPRSTARKNSMACVRSAMVSNERTARPQAHPSSFNLLSAGRSTSHATAARSFRKSIEGAKK